MTSRFEFMGGYYPSHRLKLIYRRLDLVARSGCSLAGKHCRIHGVQIGMEYLTVSDEVRPCRKGVVDPPGQTIRW